MLQYFTGLQHFFWQRFHEKGERMKKIVIIGANDFQRPLILKAKEMGLETHVFAWREGATGAADADYFYEISIVEKEQILKKCLEIQPDAVATIGSDLANITVQYLTERLGLTGNSHLCIERSTNKFVMRKALQEAGLPCPRFWRVDFGEIPEVQEYPVIVKPTDRSGSRAVMKAEQKEELQAALKRAWEQSFEKKAIVEDYLEGAEYSVETISFEGKHTCLAITKKFTTGEPHYIETGHLQPAVLAEEMQERIRRLIFQALDALEIRFGAGHSEIRIDREGNIKIIEIGSRMGGDCIGSDLVQLSTGCDFVKMVVQTALGMKPEIKKTVEAVSAIRFVMNEQDEKHLQVLQNSSPETIKKVVIESKIGAAEITDSGSRPGFYILQTQTMDEMERLLHPGPAEQPIQIVETPIQKLRFCDDSNNHFYMKRDDLQLFSFGGNKVRFAEKFLEDMQKQHCDSMIIYGNHHSNLCRILATLCCQLKIPCYMVHNTEDIKETKETGNSRILRSLGVREVRCGKSGIAQAVQKAMDELTERGYRPYYIYGNIYGQGREYVPMQAYVEAYEEVCRYEEEQGMFFDYIFLASSTNATQSGLLAGSLSRKDARRIVGISVSRKEQRGREVILQNLLEYQKKFNLDFPENIREHIYFTDRYQEGGYGVYSEKVGNMIDMIYQNEGIPLDMTYTGKAFYGMIQYLKEHQIQNKKILFLHTGGTPLFFDYIEQEHL